MQRRLFLDVVVGESTVVFELFASENKPLLVWWDAFFVLDFSLHILHGVGSLNVECESLASERPYKYLNCTSSQS